MCFQTKVFQRATSSKVLVTQVLALALYSELSCRAKAAELTFREEIRSLTCLSERPTELANSALRRIVMYRL